MTGAKENQEIHCLKYCAIDNKDEDTNQNNS